MSALYLAELREFTSINPEQLLGKLTSGLAEEGFDTTTLTTFSWQCEIAELQEAFSRLIELLPSAAVWPILFEYVLPVVGQRIDCVLLADDMILSTKGGVQPTPRQHFSKHRSTR
jgi:hypothetical protein